MTFSHEALELVDRLRGEPPRRRAAPRRSRGRRSSTGTRCVTRFRTRNTKWTASEVSNLVLPLYFTPRCRRGRTQRFSRPPVQEEGAEVLQHQSRRIHRFLQSPTGSMRRFALKGDTVAKKRLSLKAKAQITRRSLRYRRNHATTTSYRAKRRARRRDALCLRGRRDHRARPAGGAADRRKPDAPAERRPTQGSAEARYQSTVCRRPSSNDTIGL